MMFTVVVNKPRPDFRVFIDLLFGYGRNVDSDGDANPVWTREWRDLYLKDRESDASKIEIYAPDDKPDSFGVSCEDSLLEELAAIYLYSYCGETIACAGKRLSENEISELYIKHTRQFARAQYSVWHRSSKDNPFPNKAG